MTVMVRIRMPLVAAAQLAAVVVTVEEAVANEISPRTAVATAVVPEAAPTPDASIRHTRSRRERPPD